MCPQNLCRILTFVAYSKADVGVALVGREEQVEEVGGADEKLGDLGALVAANQRRGGEAAVAHLQDVVVDLGAEPAEQKDDECPWFRLCRRKIEQDEFKTQRSGNKNIPYSIFTKVQEEDFYFRQ